MLVPHRARGLQVRQAQHHAQRGRDVAEHLHQQILHELKLADWPPKLLTLQGVGKGMFVRAHRTADRLPGDEAACHAQH